MSSGSCRKTTGTGRGWDTLGHAGPSFTKPSPANDNGIASSGLEPAQPDTKGKRIHHSLEENAGISERPCPHGLCPTEASQVGVKAQREAKYLVRASTHARVSRPLQTASWPSVTDPGLVGGSGCLAAVSWRGLLCSVGGWTRRPDQAARKMQRGEEKPTSPKIIIFDVFPSCLLTSSQPHPDEGHPPPLEAVPAPWKSVGPCKSHRTESPRGLAETPGGEEAQGEEGPAAAPLDVLRLRSSSMEIREKGSEFLREELHKAQKELKLKDEECERLSRVREQLERELEELTASLFEEAHKMVRAANMKQAASEKQLKEARGKIDMLQAEVTALKTLVLTSTPASPNRELHPQLLSPTKAGPRKGHLRHKSTSSTLCPAVCPAAGHTLTPDKEGKEVDTTLFAEFQAWRESPTLDKSCPFLERVYREDVGPCLDFTMQELSALVRAAVEDNTLTIEPVASQMPPTAKVAAVECGSTNTCALSGLARACRHRIRLGDSENHYYISPSSRARITAVCNFLTYIRYIQQGLVRQEAEPMFWEITRLRKEMSLAKLGFFPQEA
ncbi:guanine nucleotide exchange factor for Rab-3A isoform X2 [Herpailurus yagouaroundi]|uniref:guanine nucleotide exchange factor for Rab-3A isoform X2 n=1 Tax=Herpailurus yagouaroundi TaxID=1608482 RepID=UPI001AD77E1B|nr:guanine nucleotide exchange factor for Rab-3A isoform X2 [Puma yagouaroundi]